MQTAILVFVILLGIAAFWAVLKGIPRLLNQARDWSEQPPGPRLDKFTGEEPVGPEGLVYLFAHDLVQPAPRRPMGSIPRDRAYACQAETELCPDDFARQLLYAVLTDLYEQGCLETQVVYRQPSFMPPYPQKQWEMQFRQTRAFPTAALAESLSVGFELCRKNRLRTYKHGEELLPEDQFFSFDEVLERALKAIRQEMTFWQRGTTCSDLRHYVEDALIAQGYLEAPAKETWLDRVRTQQPTPQAEAIAPLAAEAQALAERLAAFRLRYGSPPAPEAEPPAKPTDFDQALINASQDLDALPLDDCLRLTIHEALTALKQLEPSGEAGI